MSTFHGKQGKGAMRAHRADKVREAAERQARYDVEIAHYAQVNTLHDAPARESVRIIRNLARLTPAVS